AALLAGRAAARERTLAAWRGRVHDAASLLAEFAGCIRCHNCMVACPICYCKECLFRTATFDHPPAEYQQALQRRGAVRLPADTLLFHLTRLNHMVTSCVGCGACSSACPSRLPVATLFQAVGREVQALFGYSPGRSLEDELPLATFREDELSEVARRAASQGQS
ncbi:MAG: 4Fe-4S dicluster domain-containing protein, partial [Anaerolineae bacterium]|nr:4Fe-4S dicluster domain-containing protein [Anaerolineae bacterium]